MPQESMWLKTKTPTSGAWLDLLLLVNTRANIRLGFLARFCLEFGEFGEYNLCFLQTCPKSKRHNTTHPHQSPTPQTHSYPPTMLVRNNLLVQVGARSGRLGACSAQVTLKWAEAGRCRGALQALSNGCLAGEALSSGRVDLAKKDIINHNVSTKAKVLVRSDLENYLSSNRSILGFPRSNFGPEHFRSKAWGTGTGVWKRTHRKEAWQTGPIGKLQCDVSWSQRPNRRGKLFIVFFPNSQSILLADNFLDTCCALWPLGIS